MEHKGRRLVTLASGDGMVRLYAEPTNISAPGPGEVIVRIDAAPINPSDIANIFGPADLSTLRNAGEGLVADIPSGALGSVAWRTGIPMAVGNEGTGIVIAAGAGVEAAVGRRVAMMGGAMYANHRKVALSECLILPDDATAEDSAGLFINPLTVLGFLETMRAEGHSALVHTAAASSLGQMLVRLCAKDGVPLVNVVRNAEQVAILKGIGAEHVVNVNDEHFEDDLLEKVAITGATMAFDPIGGGQLGSQILSAMEAAILSREGGYGRYGSNIPKRLYVYGALDLSPAVMSRFYGFSWDFGGWLIFTFLERADPVLVRKMRERVLSEYDTTFLTRYSRQIGFEEILDPKTFGEARRVRTNGKFLLRPAR